MYLHRYTQIRGRGGIYAPPGANRVKALQSYLGPSLYEMFVMSTKFGIILYFSKNSNKCFPRFSAFSDFHKVFDIGVFNIGAEFDLFPRIFL